jgi:starch-binding outer membrane protein, SusD/RagB family
MPTRLRHLAAAAVLCAAGVACSDVTVPNYNNPSVDQLQTSPNLSSVNLATQGLLGGLRGQVGTHASAMGVQGREIINLDAAEPRNVTALLVGPLEPGGFGNEFSWSAAYRNIRLGLTTMSVLDQLPSLTQPQKEGIRGFTKTIIALDLMGQLRARDTLGIVVDVPLDPNAPPAEVVGKDAAARRITELLDEAATHLQAAGATPFTFQLTTGFAGFNTPATFLRVTRAIKARNEVYRRQWASALTALEGSFLNDASPTPATLQTGVYHVYSTASGDATNPLFDPTPIALVAPPAFLSEAKPRANGQPDLRAAAKAAVGTRTLSVQGVLSNVRVTRYASNTDPVPIIKNEELILLRAEARWFSGNKAGAIQDLNLVRTVSGGLPATALTPTSTDAAFVDELLYDRRYSLFFEYGHRWVDMRRFGRLAQLPKSLPSHRIFRWIPFPIDECNQRSPAPQPACSTENGI